MSPTNRIILNTLASYGQSVIALVLGLFSVRWTLEALGHTDYGLFSVVGSVILLVSILNGGLSVGVVRFYSYSIGQGGALGAAGADDDLKKWFNTAFSIHIALPLLVVLIGWPIGEYVIRHWLTIPDERLDASLVVFRISLLSAFASVLAVPYTAMFHAQQRMVEPAVIGIIKSIAVFLLAWSLLRVDSDRLVFYATFMMLIVTGGYAAQIGRAAWLFPACRPRFEYLYQSQYMRRLFSFVGWKMFGMGCVTMREQGTPILANIAFGPVVNAAYSVARGLSVHTAALSSSLIAAFQPALTTTEGKGDRQGMLAMAIQICNFGTLLVAFFAIPLILEIDNLLELWLVDPPPHAGEIFRWMLLMLIIDKMTSGPMIGVNAYGKIALYELIQGSLFLIALPLMWVLFLLGWGPVAIGFALFVSHLVYCIGRLVFARALIGFPVGTWVRRSAAPLIFALTAATLAGFGATLNVDGGLFSIIFASLASSVTIGVIAWYWVLSDSEKVHAIKLIVSFGSRLRNLQVRA